MATGHIAAILALTLTGLLPSSCTKTSTSQKTSPPVIAAAIASTADPSPAIHSKNKDLGVLDLTNHCETTVELGGGKSCRIVPELLGGKDLQLTFTLETKQADGLTEGLNVTQVMTRSGKTLDVSIGDTQFTLTPNFVE